MTMRSSLVPCCSRPGCNKFVGFELNGNNKWKPTTVYRSIFSRNKDPHIRLFHDGSLDFCSYVCQYWWFVEQKSKIPLYLYLLGLANDLCNVEIEDEHLPLSQMEAAE